MSAIADRSRFSPVYQFGDAFAFLVLSACGLAVIFGMMGVINLAHGEFIMCGAYVTVTIARLGPAAAAGDRLRARWSPGSSASLLERAGHPPSLRPAARHHRRHLGHQPDRHAGHADPARLDHAGVSARRSAAFSSARYSYSDLPPRADRRRDRRPGRALPALQLRPASACSRARRSRFRTWPRRSASTRGRSTA